MKRKSLSRTRLFVTGGQSTGFFRPECWSGQPFPSAGDLPNPGMEPGLRLRWVLYRLSPRKPPRARPNPESRLPRGLLLGPRSLPDLRGIGSAEGPPEGRGSRPAAPPRQRAPRSPPSCGCTTSWNIPGTGQRSTHVREQT